MVHIIINENDNILYAFFLLILPQPFYPDMVSKCDICNKTFKGPTWKTCSNCT